MVKIIAAILVIAVLLSGGVYYFLQPNTLPTPTFQKEPSGVAQSTLSDVRIADPSWLSENRNLLWVVCRFGEGQRVRSNLLINISDKSTLAHLRGANLISWISDHEILVYNQGNRDSQLEKFQQLLDQNRPSLNVTQFFTVDINSGNITRVCEVSSKQHLTFVDPSPDKKRLVASFGPKDTYEIDLMSGSDPRKLEEEYVWAPKWVDNDSYFFIGQTSVLSREFGATISKSISIPLLDEVRDAIKNYGSPTLKICGQIGENFLLVDHNPKLDFDRLLVLDRKTTVLEEVALLIPSGHIPRFNQAGTMMVYQGQQFDKNMDTVYLQTLEVDSKPIELVTGEFGGVQESTPVFWDEESVLYIHRGVEVRSISLADGSKELHWPISVVP